MSGWCQFSTDQSHSDLTQSFNSFTCYASPDCYDLLRPINSLVCVKTSSSSSYNRPFVLKEDATVKKNCVRFCGDFNPRTEVFVKCLENIPKLQRLQLTCHVEDGTAEEEAKRLVEQLLRDYSAIPIMAGEKVCIDKCSFVVSDTEPFLKGLWTADTKIVISFERARFSRGVDLKSIFYYSLQLIPNCDIGGVLKGIQFPYSLKEMPSTLAAKLLLGGSKKFNLSCTVIVNCQDIDEEFCSVSSSSGKTIILQSFHTGEVPKLSIFATPGLLHNLSNFFEDPQDCFQVCAVKQLPKVDVATSTHISFISSPTYNSLSTKEVDSLVTNYFSVQRYVFQHFIGEISIQEDSFSSEPSRKERQSLFYKVLRVDSQADDRVGVFVSSSHTSLYQKKTLRQHLPPKHLKEASSPGSCDGQAVYNLPAHLITVQDKIFNAIHDSSLLVLGPQGCGKDNLYQSLSDALGSPLITVESCSLIGESSGSTEAKLRQAFSQASEQTPCILLLKNVEKLSRTREGKIDHRVLDRLRIEMEEFASLDGGGALIIGDSSDSGGQDKNVVGLFDVMVRIEEPSADERSDALLWAAREVGMAESEDVDFREMSLKIAGFLLGDIRHLVKKALRCTFERLGLERDVDLVSFGPKTNMEDFEAAMAEVHKSLGDSIGAPKIPSVKWEDVGGLENAKREILDAIQMPLWHPELAASGLRRSGILMYGPPGVGKTLLAKAVATECALNFLSVKGPELLNMYVGQSEQNVRDVFQRARSASPCVIFFDELDSLAPNRGKAGDSGGVMDRVVSQLLAELDGINESGMIFVIGATNRPDLIDQALLRPGRFDRLVYLGIAEDKSEQKRIMESLLRKFKLHPDFSLMSVLEMIPKGLTGADLYSIASDASLHAISRNIRYAEEERDKTARDVLVTLDDFQAALDEFSPSVTQQDLDYYKNVKDSMSNELS